MVEGDGGTGAASTRTVQWCGVSRTEPTTFWTGQAPFRGNRYVREFYERLAAEAGAQVGESAPAQLADLVIAASERGREPSTPL